MAADDVAVLRLRDGADDRAALARARGAPTDRETRLSARLRMGGKADMVDAVGRHGSLSETPKPPPQRRAALHVVTR